MAVREKKLRGKERELDGALPFKGGEDAITPMMAPRGAAVILIVALLAAGAAYYLYSAGSQGGHGSSLNSVGVDIRIVRENGTTFSTSSTSSPSSPTTTVMTMMDIYSPDNFTVTEGQNVTLVILNMGNSTHGLVITQFGVNSGIIPPHGVVRVWFIANQVGVFKFYEPEGYCKGGIGCGDVQNMFGYMTVKHP
jgi:heme/copper-type cytochrome/quinol oxidase subunit 2